METTVKNIGLLFMGIVMIVIWGFYHTFFRLFATFNRNNIGQHVHYIAFLLWFALLVAMAVLIKLKQFSAYKALQRCFCFLAPLVMFAIYYVVKEQYVQDVNGMTENEAIARQTLGLPSVFAFAALSILAMLFKESAFHYTRYTIAATLLLIGLGLSYAFVVYIHFPFSMGVLLSFIITDLALLTLMVNDKIYGHTLKPYLFSLIITMVAQLVWYCVPNTIVWQSAAGKLAQVFL